MKIAFKGLNIFGLIITTKSNLKKFSIEFNLKDIKEISKLITLQNEKIDEE